MSNGFWTASLAAICPSLAAKLGAPGLPIFKIGKISRIAPAKLGPRLRARVRQCGADDLDLLAIPKPLLQKFSEGKAVLVINCNGNRMCMIEQGFDFKTSKKVVDPPPR